MNRPKLLYSFFLLCVCFAAGAQQYNFRNYSVKDGIAQSQVYCLLQDSRGYLWMGTRGGGLTRFDGTNFKTFTVRDGLANNYISCITEDAQHNLWIGTGNGLSHYNGIRFKNYKPSGDTLPVAVQAVATDQKGRKWMATNAGVWMLDGDRFTNVSARAGQFPQIVNAILADSMGRIWCGGADGLLLITEASGKFNIQYMSRQNRVMANVINTIRKDATGNLWIGTYGDGVYVYNGKRFRRIDEHLELYRKIIFDIYFDNHNNAWLATPDGGVCQYNQLAKSFNWLGEKEGLSNNHVRCILQDRSGNYWFGTSGGGVCNYFGKQFTNYDRNSGLGGNFIYSIYRDRNRRLWVATSDKGVSVLDSGRFSGYNASNGFADVKVKSFCEDLNGILYLGTEGRGLFSFDGTTFLSVDELGKKHIKAMVRDKEGNIFIATAGNGLYKLIPSATSYTVQHFDVEQGLPSSRLTCLHYDQKGRLWYGTESNGAGVMVNDLFSTQVLTTKNGLPSNAIRCFTEDHKGYLWIGTAGNGIASVPLYQGDYKVSAYDHHNGLTSTNVYLLTTDQFNNLFVGTEAGLDHITFDSLHKISGIRHYSKGEGFTGVETCQNAVYNDSNGTIWFGTINCLSKYDPSNKFRNETEPVTTITDVRLFYESIATTAYKSSVGDWNTIRNLVLPHKQNHLTFDFLGINFSNPEAVYYQWKLEGFDHDWSPPSQQRTVTYSNTGYGDFTFLVKACNEDGVWNKTPVAFHYRITPPFWMRWWVITLFVLALVGLVMFVFRWRVNLVRKKAMLQQQQIQMEKELVELEQKALRLQMNPHFIFNALNSIQSQIGTNNEQTARYYLAKFSRLMRQILDNSRNTVITLQEEISTLENYLLIEKFCNGDRFDYRMDIDPDIDVDYITIPPMLLQPFIENAIKHGLKFTGDKRGLIIIEIKEKNGVLECAVIDNGIGREKAAELNKTSKETYHKSTALEVTRERLALVSMETHVVPLEIIDLYDEQNNPAGTKVVVRVPIG